jgi:hypothetical protein
MSARDMAVFASETEARDAYFKDEPGGSGGPSPDPESGWNEPTTVEELEGGWSLISQSRVEGESTRWFLLGGPNGGEALKASGQTEAVDEGATLDEVPSIETETAAREAHQKWLEEFASKAKWGNWGKVDELPPWFVYRRDHNQDDRSEWQVKGKTRDGSEIWLGPDGSPTDEPHTFTSRSAVDKAIEAYRRKVESGDIPDDQRPTGSPPSAPDGDQEGGSSGSIVSMIVGNPVVLVGVIVVAYLLYRRYGGGGVDG